MRRIVAVAVFAVACHWQAAFAQTIVVPDLTPAGKIADVRIDGLPEDARVLFQADAGADIRNAGLGRAHATGVTGSHSIGAVIAPKEGDLIALSAVLRIGEAPPIPPPIVQTLAQLAGDKAPALSAMYAEFAAALDGDLFTDVAHFRRTEAAALEGRELAGHGATVEIAKRLDVATLDELKAALAKVIEELGAPPVPPGPTPGPSPIPVAGLHVLIVEETDDRGRIPPSQLGVLTTTQIKSAVEGTGGKFRQYDDDPEIEAEPWKTARDRPRTALPWIIVSGDKGGVEQPLPATIEETLALIRRFE